MMRVRRNDGKDGNVILLLLLLFAFSLTYFFLKQTQVIPFKIKHYYFCIKKSFKNMSKSEEEKINEINERNFIISMPRRET